LTSIDADSDQEDEDAMFWSFRFLKGVFKQLGGFPKKT